MVEGAALEMLFGGNFNEGSNPSLSVLLKVLGYQPKTFLFGEREKGEGKKEKLTI